MCIRDRCACAAPAASTGCRSIRSDLRENKHRDYIIPIVIIIIINVVVVIVIIIVFKREVKNSLFLISAVVLVFLLSLRHSVVKSPLLLRHLIPLSAPFISVNNKITVVRIWPSTLLSVTGFPSRFFFHPRTSGLNVITYFSRL